MVHTNHPVTRTAKCHPIFGGSPEWSAALRVIETVSGAGRGACFVDVLAEDKIPFEFGGSSNQCNFFSVGE